ncbi:TetR-like C-terminal domain-containing protein [Streptomyces sp. NPDC048255]|uniref:TetR-like C-terminal domain-containing protein n=1 Tax=Streptomyces sp. NPDC048255 TaxID=3154713 RepID=UPI0033D34635
MRTGPHAGRHHERAGGPRPAHHRPVGRRTHPRARRGQARAPPRPLQPGVRRRHPRAVERGELPADTDPAELLKALAAPLYFRLVFTDEPVDEVTAERAVRVALAAARAHLLASA